MDVECGNLGDGLIDLYGLFMSFQVLILVPAGFFSFLKWGINALNQSNTELLALLTWQTALKLLAGDDQELLQIIPVLLGCNKQNLVERKFIDKGITGETVELMKEIAF